MRLAQKARAIGISNCYAWQLAQANYYARMHGMAEFVSVQGHYNLIFREEEREMAPFCKAENIAMTPYSALAAGRLSRRPDESSKRLEEDNYAKFKYDKTAETDGVIITSNTSVLRFNAASNQLRFRYYKGSSYANQQAIQLYKLEG